MMVLHVNILIGTFYMKCLLISIVVAQHTATEGNLDELINQIFTPPPDRQIPDRSGALIGSGIVTGPSEPELPLITSPIAPMPPTRPVNPCSEGECVPYYLCANGSIITNGEGLLDIRFGGANNPNPAQHPCHGIFETCCTVRSVTPILPTVRHAEGCGFRNVDGIGFRITGDQNDESQFAEFPWMVAILREELAGDQVINIFQCGASLIHPSVVLTAAHCASGKLPHQLKIRAGEWDTQTKDELLPHQDRDVIEILIHPEYYKGGLFNDIALLFLSQPLQLASNINTICLPPEYYSFDGSRCIASGWGKNSFGKSGHYQVILKKIELPIVPRATCLDSLRTTRLGVHFELHRSFICAGGEIGRDTCKGDGGSPLVCPIPNTINQYYQAGIVSWGVGCGNQTPGVYVNVPLFRHWIDEEIKIRNLATSFYST